MRGKLAWVLAVACFGALTGLALAEQIDNPEYQKWAKFKPGTEVTTKTDMVSKMGGTENKMETTTTTKLTAITPDEATLETTSKMSMGGTDMPATTMPPRKVPAKIEKPAPVAAAAAPTDVKDGTDKVEISGKSYDAKTHEQTTDMNGMKTTSKMWSSDDIPGGMLKMESSTTGSMESTMKTTVVEVKMP